MKLRSYIFGIYKILRGDFNMFQIRVLFLWQVCIWRSDQIQITTVGLCCLCLTTSMKVIVGHFITAPSNHNITFLVWMPILRKPRVERQICRYCESGWSWPICWLESGQAGRTLELPSSAIVVIDCGHVQCSFVVFKTVYEKTLVAANSSDYAWTGRGAVDA